MASAPRRPLAFVAVVAAIPSSSSQLRVDPALATARHDTFVAIVAAVPRRPRAPSHASGAAAVERARLGSPQSSDRTL